MPSNQQADPISVAKAIALRQLNLAPRSRAQLATKMASKGVPDDICQVVLDRLTEVGLVNDRAYAEMLVRSRIATKGLARTALLHELRKAGIADEVAQAALVDTPDEAVLAVELVRKRLRTMSGLTTEVQLRRLAGYLTRKGYAPGVAYAAVRTVLGEST